ncbi:antibiotic biosynthesis monooxygenase (plasmid) [Fibrella sp. ES10-3-2-2]
MEKVALLARVQAKPGQEATVENFLTQALAMAQQEEGTLRWYAFKINENTFGIFDTFGSESGRQAHLSGEIAKALLANAEALLSVPPVIEQLDLIAVK